MSDRTIFYNQRYVSYWFTLDPQTMAYKHNVKDITISREKLDTLIHTQDLEGLLDNLGIIHADVI